MLIVFPNSIISFSASHLINVGFLKPMCLHHWAPAGTHFRHWSWWWTCFCQSS